MNGNAIPSQSRHALENKIPPPVVVLGLGAAMWAAAGLRPALEIEGNTRLVAALVFVCAGLFFLSQGLFAFRRARTTIDPVRLESASTVVKDGIYRRTRNPMYVGFTCLLLAWAIYLAGVWAMLGPLVFVLFINRFQIVPEERVLSAKFGADYDNYRQRVRRWL